MDPSSSPPPLDGRARLRRRWTLAAVVLLIDVHPSVTTAQDLTGSAAVPEQPPPLSYRIDARVDPVSRRFDGTVTVDRRATGDVPPRFHTYLNAFAHEETTWMRTASAERTVAGLLRDGVEDPWGWIIPVDAQCGTAEAASKLSPAGLRWVVGPSGNALDRTVVELTGDHCRRAPRIRMRFRGRFPEPIARTGGVDGWLMGAQWFPKLVAAQPGRPAPIPDVVDHAFFGPTEFFADFADYDVRLDVPEGWTVVATGVRRGDPEPTEDGHRRSRFRARWVHDFAFLAARDVAVLGRRHRPPGRDRPVHLEAVVPASLAVQGERMLDALAASLDVLGRRVGPYPYDVATVVGPPFAAGRTAGMEYPTLIVGLFADPLWDRFPGFRLPELVVAHELAHQYFYGLVATNEMAEAWLDEGFTEYWTWEILAHLAGDGPAGGRFLGRPVRADDVQRGRMTAGPGTDDVRPRLPVASFPSRLMPPDDIGLHFYRRPSTLFATAARRFGQDAVDRVFRAWVARHAFRHPTAADLRAVLDDVAPPPMARFLVEGLTHAELPSFAVTHASSRRWTRPRGRLAEVGFQDVADQEAPLRPSADPDLLGLTGDESDGLWMLLHEPGAGAALLAPGADATIGRYERVRHPWSTSPDGRRGATPAPGQDGQLWETRVRIEGPSYRHLPTTYRLRFEDGAVVRGRWDARAPHRELTILRPSPLSVARLAPFPADPTPADDARRRTADQGFLLDWWGWTVAAFHWLATTTVPAWL